MNDDTRFDNYKKENEDRLKAMAAIVEAQRIDVAVMKSILEGLNENLYGGDGREGIIPRIENRLAAHDKWIYIATGAIVAMQFLSGSGVLSLKGLIGH